MKRTQIARWLGTVGLTLVSFAALAGIIYATGLGVAPNLGDAQVYAQAAAYNDCYIQSGSPAGPTSYYGADFDGENWTVMAVVPCAVL